MLHESIVKRAQRNESTILNALSKVSQEKVAELVGLGSATISTFKSENISRLAAVLAACGLRVAPETATAIDPDELRNLRKTAIRYYQEQLDNPADSAFGSF